MNEGPYRRSYADDPALLDRVFSLLELAFPGLPAHARALDPLGLRWDEVSVPFVLTGDGQPVMHVGVLEVPMVVDDHDMLVGGIHAVCTHPDHRRRGYFRSVMDEALRWCDERYAAVVLSGDPELYEQFGFRLLKESRFIAPVSRSATVPDGQELRQLDPHRPDDLRLLHRLLDERAPVSRRLGVVRERGVFLFNQATQPMWYAEDLDAILCFKHEDATLRLYDIVTTQIPTLRQIVDRMHAPIERVEVYFAPDQLGASLESEPHVFGGDGWIMARGSFPQGQCDVMLPSTARF